MWYVRIKDGRYVRDDSKINDRMWTNSTTLAKQFNNKTYAGQQAQVYANKTNLCMVVEDANSDDLIVKLPN